MNRPPEAVTYLTFDSLSEGVGASQVLPYVQRIAAAGIRVRLDTFEKQAIDPAVQARLMPMGVDWRPHAFGRSGARAGAARVLRGARLVRSSDFVHARSDLAAASALLARRAKWLWDVRSFWADQRIALGSLESGSPEYHVLRAVERRAARSATAIVTLTAAAVETLAERHGADIAGKAFVIPTCVDLARFRPAEMPRGDTIRLLFSGTLNRYYDTPAMIRLVEIMQRIRPVELSVLAPGATAWDGLLERHSVSRMSVRPADVVSAVQAAHVGLSICRLDAGVSLRAAMPTKIAEFLACGRPVVVGLGLGDLDRLLPQHKAGVVVQDTSPDGLATAADELLELLADPGTPARCRALAETHFDLERGVRSLLAAYRHASR